MNDNTVLDEYNNPVIIHTKEEFKKMREAGKLASQVLRLYNSFCKRKNNYFGIR